MKIKFERPVGTVDEWHPAADGEPVEIVSDLKAFLVVEGDRPESVHRRRELALAIAGARAKGDQKGWANVLHRLRHADLAKLRGQFPDYPYEDLLKAIDASVEALALEGWRDRYLDLAVFPEDVPIPEATVYAFWEPLGMDEYEAQDALERLVNLSLLRRDDQNRYTLHDLQYDYVRNEGVRKQAGVESLTALNGRFFRGVR